MKKLILLGILFFANLHQVQAQLHCLSILEDKVISPEKFSSEFEAGIALLPEHEKALMPTVRENITTVIRALSSKEVLFGQRSQAHQIVFQVVDLEKPEFIGLAGRFYMNLPILIRPLGSSQTQRVYLHSDSLSTDLKDLQVWDSIKEQRYQAGFALLEKAKQQVVEFIQDEVTALTDYILRTNNPREKDAAALRIAYYQRVTQAYPEIFRNLEKAYREGKKIRLRRQLPFPDAESSEISGHIIHIYEQPPSRMGFDITIQFSDGSIGAIDAFFTSSQIEE